jgi:CDP-diacylglycerol diphosphatase
MSKTDSPCTSCQPSQGIPNGDGAAARTHGLNRCLIRRESAQQSILPAPLYSGNERVSGGFLLHKVTSFAATMGLLLATAAGLPHSVSAANRNGLWVVVHDICLPAYQGIGVAFPCAEVNIANGLDRGFAVLQTPSSATHVIVVPTTRISGIENPALLRENAPNYWEAAWDARRFVEEGAGRRLSRDKIGMAINSAASRSQDQLHIHVACIAPTVANFLRRHQAEIHEAWSFLSPALFGHRFAAMKVKYLVTKGQRATRELAGAMRARDMEKNRENNPWELSLAVWQ